MRLGGKGSRRSAVLQLKGIIRSIRRIAPVGACLVLALLFAQAANATALVQKGHNYAASDAARTIKNPTLTGAESKLWFKDGRWWGVLWDTTSGSHHHLLVHR